MSVLVVEGDLHLLMVFEQLFPGPPRSSTVHRPVADASANWSCSTYPDAGDTSMHSGGGGLPPLRRRAAGTARSDHTRTGVNRRE